MRTRTLLLTLTCLCVSGFAMAAQPANGVNGLAETTIEVKPGMNQQFEEVIKAAKAAAEKTKAPNQWRISRSMTGSNSYIIDSGFASWAEFALPLPDMQAALGAKEAQRLGDLFRSSVTSISRATYTFRQDLSRMWPDGTTAQAVEHVYLKPKPGAGPALESLVKRLIEATNAVQKNNYWLMAAPGAGADSYLVIVIHPKWTDMDAQQKPAPQILAEHFGAQEGQVLWSALQNSVENLNAVIGMAMPDLSRVTN
jgi:hypothetical protein